VKLRTAATTAACAIALAGCVRASLDKADALRGVPREPLGEDRISLKWKFQTEDRRIELGPQEFAAATVYDDVAYIGSASGIFFALRATTGEMLWKRSIGAVGTAPIVFNKTIYIGTMKGTLIALDRRTGDELWRYQSRGAIEQPPVLTSGDMLLFSNAESQVVALDATSGKLKWQYKTERPEEYWLRGHAGVAVDGDMVYTGFANGSLVAFRRDTGSVAWSTSLKGDAEKFFDADGTPLVIGDRIYETSASGGVFAVDKATGLVRWRVPFYDVALPSSQGNVGGITSDGKVLYVSVADLGLYAIDLQGNVLWRVGGHRGGEPGTPVLFHDLVLWSLAEDGLFLANRRTGDVVEWFDPGDGVSAQPTVTGDGQLLVMSNRSVLYAFDLD
jgi:outer membrane protein assembly factor BamB